MMLRFVGTTLAALLAAAAACSGRCGSDAGDPTPSDPLTARFQAASATRVALRVHNGLVRTLSGRVQTSAPPGASAETVAEAFLEEFGETLGVADAAADLAWVETRQADDTRVVIYGRVHRGLPVFSSTVRIAVDADGRVTWVGAQVPTPLELSTTPTLSREEAQAALSEALARRGASGVFPVDAVLGIHDPSLARDGVGTPVLAWLVRAEVTSPPSLALAHVDAGDGSLWTLLDGTQRARDRRVHGIVRGYPNRDAILTTHNEPWYAESGELPPPEPPNDLVLDRAAGHALEVFDALGTTYDYFARWGWDGWDGRGSPSRAFVGYELGQDHWSPWVKALFLHEWGTNLDTIAHEVAHGVAQTTVCGGATECVLLDNRGEPGALSEHCADLFASFVDADWLQTDRQGVVRDLAQSPAYRGLGGSRYHYCAERRDASGAYLGTPPAECFRLPEAGASGDPLDVNDFPHANSGIPSLAAVLLADGGTHPSSGVVVQGIGREKVERIYWRAVYLYVQPASTFEDLRYQVLRSCTDYASQVAGTTGITYEDCGWILNAFHAVGVGAPDTDRCGARVCPDTWADDVDNCPLDHNPVQTDTDADGRGDDCDPDGEPPPDAGTIEPGAVSCPAELPVRECDDRTCQVYCGDSCSPHGEPVSWPLDTESPSYSPEPQYHADAAGHYFLLRCSYRMPGATCTAGFMAYWTVPGDTGYAPNFPQYACDTPGPSTDSLTFSRTHQAALQHPCLGVDEVWNEDVTAFVGELFEQLDGAAAPCE
jgi:hypothetical protein